MDPRSRSTLLNLMLLIPRYGGGWWWCCDVVTLLVKCEFYSTTNYTSVSFTTHFLLIYIPHNNNAPTLLRINTNFSLMEWNDGLKRKKNIFASIFALGHEMLECKKKNKSLKGLCDLWVNQIWQLLDWCCRIKERKRVNIWGMKSSTICHLL